MKKMYDSDEPKKKRAFKVESENEKKIFNNTWNQDEKPSEIYRLDYISAMKMPNHTSVNKDFVKITDPWKQEYDKGVQVPVDVDSVPTPEFITYKDIPSKPDYVLPNDYISHVKMPNLYDFVESGNIPTEPYYDMDEKDMDFFTKISQIKKDDVNQAISESQFELVITYFDAMAQVRMLQFFFENQSQSYSIDYDEHVKCEICKDIYNEPENMIIFCDSCNIIVHQKCYGIDNVPSGPWHCSPCKAGVLSPVCLFCMQSSEGAFKPIDSGEWVHIFCALWIPEVGFGNAKHMEPVNQLLNIPAMRWSLTCCMCQQRVGACIQCDFGGCDVAFHPSCAYENGSCMMLSFEKDDQEVSYSAFCLKHSEEKWSSPIPENSFILPSNDTNELNPLYTKQSKILNKIKSNFYEHVDVDEVAGNLDINIYFVSSVFKHWKSRRKENGNNPLVALPDLPTLVSQHKLLKKTGDDTGELDPFFNLIALRQDLERARSLVYLIVRRERLKKKLMESIAEVVEDGLKGKGGTAIPPFPPHMYKLLPLRATTNGGGSGGDGGTDDSDTSMADCSKVLCAPARHLEKYYPSQDEMLVAQEVVLSEEDAKYKTGRRKRTRKEERMLTMSEDKENNSGKNNDVSSDPEWDSVKPRKRSRTKAKKPPSKRPTDSSNLCNKYVLAFSDGGECRSSQDEFSHFSTPPTSPEYGKCENEMSHANVSLSEHPSRSCMESDKQAITSDLNTPDFETAPSSPVFLPVSDTLPSGVLHLEPEQPGAPDCQFQEPTAPKSRQLPVSESQLTLDRNKSDSVDQQTPTVRRSNRPHVKKLPHDM